MSVAALETSNDKQKWICRNVVIFTWLIKQWLFVTDIYADICYWLSIRIDLKIGEYLSTIKRLDYFVYLFNCIVTRDPMNKTRQKNSMCTNILGPTTIPPD